MSYTFYLGYSNKNHYNNEMVNQTYIDNIKLVRLEAASQMHTLLYSYIIISVLLHELKLELWQNYYYLTFQWYSSNDNLYNLSLYPLEVCQMHAWKMSRLVPIPKSTDTFVPLKFRPISILSIIIKVLECVVYQYGTSFSIFALPRQISPKQWAGFLPGR